MGTVMVNRSGTNFNVYTSNTSTGLKGTIYPNKVYSRTGEWSGNAGSGYI